MAERVKCTFTWFYSNFIGKKPSWILSRTPLNEGYPGMTLNMKKSFPKNRKKDPKHHLIWYFAYFYRYRHQYLSTYPKKFGQTIFLKYGSKISWLPMTWKYIFKQNFLFWRNLLTWLFAHQSFTIKVWMHEWFSPE